MIISIVILLLVGCFVFNKYFIIIPKSEIADVYHQHRKDDKYSIVSDKWIYMKDEQMNAMVDMFIEMGERRERNRQVYVKKS